MSLILDALRKSEAERRRGQAPDLFASVPLSRHSQRRDLLRYWPWLVFAALVIAAGFVFWRAQPDLSTTPAAPVEEVADLGEQEGEGAEPRSALSSSTLPAPRTSANASAELPVAMSEGPAAQSAAQLPPSAQAGSRQQPEKPIATPAASLPPPIATLPAPPPPSPADNIVENETLPPIAILSASERASLPPLKVSMHVFGGESGNRFAIIDGQRVTEGSIIGNSVIEKIRNDGVVLNINGRRILLPRP